MKNLTPLKIILFWIFLSHLIVIISMIIIGISTSGGEQKPFELLAHAIPVIVWGTLIISVLTIPFYWKWIKQHWYINTFFIVACCMFIYINIMEEKKGNFEYSTSIEYMNVGDKRVQKKIEYYGNNFNKIRSISFYIGDKKDSIWTIFSENGNIISKRKYKSGVLIEIEK